MISQTKIHSQWTPEELELLKYYEPRFKSKKWKNISQQLRKKGFYRSQTQCRERWINFLDPKANKAKWQEEQLRHLYDTYEEVGTKWCLIQRQLNRQGLKQGRTQNSIKNRFYGTLRNYVRFILSYFDSRRTCYNKQISKLSPKFLTDLFGSHNGKNMFYQEFEFLNGEIKNTIYQMKFIVDKKIIVEHIKKQRKRYQKLNQIILDTFQQIMAQTGSNSSERYPIYSEDEEAKVEDIPQQPSSVKQEENSQNVPLHSVTVIQEPWNQGKLPFQPQINPWFLMSQYPQYIQNPLNQGYLWLS